MNIKFSIHLDTIHLVYNVVVNLYKGKRYRWKFVFALLSTLCRWKIGKTLFTTFFKNSDIQQQCFKHKMFNVQDDGIRLNFLKNYLTFM